jgi:hypothetical protein
MELLVRKAAIQLALFMRQITACGQPAGFQHTANGAAMGKQGRQKLVTAKGVWVVK